MAYPLILMDLRGSGSSAVPSLSWSESCRLEGKSLLPSSEIVASSPSMLSHASFTDSWVAGPCIVEAAIKDLESLYGAVRKRRIVFQVRNMVIEGIPCDSLFMLRAECGGVSSVLE